MADYTLVKFSPNLTVHPITDPMAVYTDWPTAEAAAIVAQTAITDGTQVAILMAVATTAIPIVVQPVTITLTGATAPTTV